MGRGPRASSALIVVAAIAGGTGDTRAGTTTVEANVTNGITGPGHLDIDVDEFGSSGLYLGPNFDDHYQPIDASDREASSIILQHLFVTTSDGGVTAVSFSASKTVWTALQGFAQAQGIAGDRNLTRTIVQSNTPISPSEVQSTFQITDTTAPAVDLEISVDQRIEVAGATSIFHQDYAIQNASASPVDLVLVAQWDLDLSWSGPAGHEWNDDIVGVGAGLCYVYQHEPGSSTEAVSLDDGQSDVPIAYYHAAKRGVAPPDGGTPAYGNWLDHQIWDTRQTPTSWRNSLANVDYNVAGESGSTPGDDAMIGTEYRFSLAPGETKTIRLRRHYGTVALPCVTVSATCGDGHVDPGEDCDSGGVDTATCNGTLCTTAACGDNYVNAAAGETCESNGVDSVDCDAATCTTPRCGDGHANAAAGEACDSSGVDTAACNGATCTAAACGDGVVNTAAGEECDGDSLCDVTTCRYAYRVGGGCTGCTTGDAHGTGLLALLVVLGLGRKRPRR